MSPHANTEKAAGIEPASNVYGKTERACDCANCEECLAASALHSGRPNWLDLSAIDADLLNVVLAWEKISNPICNAIVTLAQSSRQRSIVRTCGGSGRAQQPSRNDAGRDRRDSRRT